jgi:hypothetical protein
MKRTLSKHLDAVIFNALSRAIELERYWGGDMVAEKEMLGWRENLAGSSFLRFLQLAQSSSETICTERALLRFRQE